MLWVYDDGGRRVAGFFGQTGDCTTRAIAIATGKPYREVYDDLARRNRDHGDGKRSARNGVPRKVYDGYLRDEGWVWTPTMRIGSGCTVHLRDGEIPGGAVIARLSGHICAVIDGVIRDLYDPSRDGTRCVYGYWTKP